MIWPRRAALRGVDPKVMLGSECEPGFRKGVTMSWIQNRRATLAGLAAAFAIATTSAVAAQDIPATPEPGPIKMGIEPWLGYGQWHIAAKKGLFEQAGPRRRRDRQLHHRRRHQRRARRGPAAGGQHRHAHGDELHRRRPADQDRGAARRLEDRRRDHLRRLGHRHRRAQGQAGRLRGGHDQRHPAQLRAGRRTA